MTSKLLILACQAVKFSQLVQQKVTRLADIIGDIGYKPSANSKLKWKGKEAITTRKLQDIQGQQRMRKRPSSSQSKEP
ncbi:hypothetical protein K7X08_031870 [Anisodus acutangulus]|uniref:Uncharacterized protein n=1 Tax=Anisodus acutangulus TaxID=402998 RepID=A0A9Q1RJQ6_9SOLA|nr:hypothetical protein K7X08_031870 [Anisodus acutangulus]